MPEYLSKETKENSTNEAKKKRSYSLTALVKDVLKIENFDRHNTTADVDILQNLLSTMILRTLSKKRRSRRPGDQTNSTSLDFI